MGVRIPGIAGVAACVLALLALMAGALHGRGWVQGWLYGPPEIHLVAGPQDHERAHFTLCRGPSRTACVIDGDTLWYKGDKIRVADINTPQTAEPACDAELDKGEKAATRMIALLNEGPFTLEPLHSKTPHDTDRAGRKLRSILRGGHSLGEVLVAEGLAERWIGFRRDWCD